MTDNPRQYFMEQILPHSGKMFGVAVAITGSREEAADEVQTAMLRIWEAIHNGKRPESPLAYCISTIRNICLTEVNRSVRFTSLEMMSEKASGNGACELSLELKEVMTKLRHLPDKERQAVEMAAFGGSSSEDIAQALCTSSANARQLLSRGRKKLRDWFK